MTVASIIPYRDKWGYFWGYLGIFMSTVNLSNLDAVGDRRSARHLLSPHSRHGRFLPRWTPFRQIDDTVESSRSGVCHYLAGRQPCAARARDVENARTVRRLHLAEGVLVLC
jgi:hypothetical protein